MVFALLIVLAWANGAPNCTLADTTSWLADSLNEMETIHSGMTRQDLAKVFHPAGGFFSSTRFKGKFVYRDSPYISIDVEFARPAGETDDNSPTSPKDVITSVSRPYLAQPVSD
jgi:hypothetical protein